MLVYYFLFVQIFFCDLILNPSKKNKKIYVFINFIFFLAVSFFRSSSVGTDFKSYLYQFNKVSLNFNISEILNYKDPGYLFFIKVIKNISINERFFVFVASLFFIFFVSRFIYKFSPKVNISFYLLLTGTFFSFSLTGIRQSLAISLILFAFTLFKENKRFGSLFIILIASTLHFSSIIFLVIFTYNLIAYVIKSLYRSTLFFSAIIYLIYNNYNYLIEKFLTSEVLARSIYDMDSNQGYYSLLIMIFIFVIALLRRKKMLEKNEHINLILFLYFFAIIFQSFVPFISEFFRIAMYFNIFILILIPYIIESFDDIFLKKITNFFVILMFGIVYLFFTKYDSGVVPYQFYFNTN